MKNEKTKLIIWAVVALVIGVLIGAFLIGPMTTTGDATIGLNKYIKNYGTADILITKGGCWRAGGVVVNNNTECALPGGINLIIDTYSISADDCTLIGGQVSGDIRRQQCWIGNTFIDFIR
jgi:hypothetical protein